MKNVIILTNNPLVRESLSKEYNLLFLECGHAGLLKAARDKIHQGYKLLSHPLSGSVKPNETPYKSLLLSACPERGTDMESVLLIEDAIAAGEKFSPRQRELTDRVLGDFQTVDLALIKGALQ